MSAKISVFVNGKARQIDATLTIGDLVEALKLRRPAILIEYNGVALHRDEWAGQTLEHGDRVEMIKMVAGG
jgi:thiamine biosynthesis protein ThiS